MICTRCHQDLPESDFPVSRVTKLRRELCRPCVLRSNAMKWKLTHPERTAAHQAVAHALKHGKLKRPSQCQRCGSELSLIAHHHSYAKRYRLDIEWLCDRCHRGQHKKSQPVQNNA